MAYDVSALPLATFVETTPLLISSFVRHGKPKIILQKCTFQLELPVDVTQKSSSRQELLKKFSSKQKLFSGE